MYNNRRMYCFAKGGNDLEHRSVYHQKKEKESSNKPKNSLTSPGITI